MNNSLSLGVMGSTVLTVCDFYVHFRCKQCSEVKLTDPNPFEDVQVINEKTVAAGAVGFLGYHC